MEIKRKVLSRSWFNDNDDEDGHNLKVECDGYSLIMSKETRDGQTPVIVLDRGDLTELFNWMLQEGFMSVRGDSFRVVSTLKD